MNWRAAMGGSSLSGKGSWRLTSRQWRHEQARSRPRQAKGLLAPIALSIGGMFAAQFAAAEPPLMIERLLADGWEIAGYASGYDNRTSLILFRHPGQNALVQCGILFDVTRNPHTIINCYELR